MKLYHGSNKIFEFLKPVSVIYADDCNIEGVCFATTSKAYASTYGRYLYEIDDSEVDKFILAKEFLAKNLSHMGEYEYVAEEPVKVRIIEDHLGYDMPTGFLIDMDFIDYIDDNMFCYRDSNKRFFSIYKDRKEIKRINY